MRLLIIILCLNLTACCIRQVKIPVPTCKEPVIEIEKPLLVNTLDTNATTQDILKAFTHDHIYLLNLKNQYRILLEGYKQGR